MSKIKIKEEMIKEPIKVPPSMTMKEALELMKKMGIRHLPITEDSGDILGVVSERDIIKAQGFVSEQTQISEIMNKSPYVVFMNEPIQRILESMIDNKIGSALVKYHTGQIAGIFTSIDAHKLLLRLLSESNEKDAVLESYWTPEMEMSMQA